MGEKKINQSNLKTVQIEFANTNGEKVKDVISIEAERDNYYSHHGRKK